MINGLKELRSRLWLYLYSQWHPNLLFSSHVGYAARDRDLRRGYTGTEIKGDVHVTRSVIFAAITTIRTTCCYARIQSLYLATIDEWCHARAIAANSRT